MFLPSTDTAWMRVRKNVAADRTAAPMIPPPAYASAPKRPADSFLRSAREHMVSDLENVTRGN